MKKWILLLCFLPMLAFGQTFTFHSDTLNLHGQPGDIFDHYADIHNISSDSLNITIYRTQNNLPTSEWTSSICVGFVCLPPEIDSIDCSQSWVYGPLAPDSIMDFHLLVYSDPSIPGTAVITIKVENQANPNDTASLTFTFSTEATKIIRKQTPVTGTFQLHANYPNPFNPETNIPFEIGGHQSVPVKLSVYNVIGQLVATPVDRVLSPGVYEAAWDGRDKYGTPVSSGLYFYELSAGNYRMLGKMILMK